VPKARLAAGSIVLMSIISIPGRPVSVSPPAPLTTPATSGVFGSMVMTTSQAATSAARSVARAAPRSTSTAMCASAVSNADSANPLRRSDVAIGRPMLPSPMKPIRSRCVAMTPPREQGRAD
jgi:hypothetical protein